MEYNEEAVPQFSISDESKRLQQEKKLKMFQENGYPMPMPVVSAAHPAILNKIQQIKAGLKKNEFNDIIYKEVQDVNAPVHMNVPLNKKAQQQQRRPGTDAAPKAGGIPPPELFHAAPQGMDSSLMEAERILFGDTGPAKPVARQPIQGQTYAGVGNRINELAQPTDEEAAYNTQNIVQKFHANISQKQAALQQQQAMMQQQPMVNPNQFYNGQQPVQMPYPYPVQQPMLPPGTMLVNEEDLKKKIINISTQVAKKISENMIKTVLSEYLKQSKNTIVESERVKKAEVVGENIVKIDGKIFKLVPATVKVKE